METFCSLRYSRTWFFPVLDSFSQFWPEKQVYASYPILDGKNRFCTRKNPTLSYIDLSWVTTEYWNMLIFPSFLLTSHACALLIDNVGNYLYLNKGSFKSEVGPHQFNLREKKKTFKSWQVYDWLAKGLIILGFMDLRWPMVYQRSNVGLVTELMDLTYKFWSIFVVTWSLNFQGQIWNSLYLGQKWFDCHETKSKHIDWTLSLKWDHWIWPWP